MQELLFGPLLLISLLASEDLPGAEAHAFHKVQLRTSLPERCLSVPAGEGLSFVFDIRDVEDMVTKQDGKWTTEEERKLLVRTQQARALLATPAGKADSIGCEVQEESGDGAYALLTLAKHGQARVWDANSKVFLPEVESREDNVDCSQGIIGTITFRKPQGPAFLRVLACTRHGLLAAPRMWVPATL